MTRRYEQWHGGPANGPGRGGEAKGTREPFAPGNEVARKHGAYSPRKVDPLARELVDHVLAVADVEGLPWLNQASHGPALWAWARAEVRVQLLTEWLEAQSADGNAGGLLDDDGEVRSAAMFLDRCEKEAAGARSRLGLDPLARARLGRDVAAQNLDLARVWAQQDHDEHHDQEDDDGE